MKRLQRLGRIRIPATTPAASGSVSVPPLQRDDDAAECDVAMADHHEKGRMIRVRARMIPGGGQKPAGGAGAAAGAGSTATSAPQSADALTSQASRESKRRRLDMDGHWKGGDGAAVGPARSAAPVPPKVTAWDPMARVPLQAKAAILKAWSTWGEVRTRTLQQTAVHCISSAPHARTQRKHRDNRLYRQVYTLTAPMVPLFCHTSGPAVYAGGLLHQCATFGKLILPPLEWAAHSLGIGARICGCAAASSAWWACLLATLTRVVCAWS